MEIMKHDNLYRGNNSWWPRLSGHQLGRSTDCSWQHELFLGSRCTISEPMRIHQTLYFESRHQCSLPVCSNKAELVCPSIAILKDDSIDSFVYIGKC